MDKPKQEEMKKLLVIFAALVCGAVAMAQNVGYRSVGVEEFAAIIADTSVVRLDVRTAKEYGEGHIAGAVNIDVLQQTFAAEVEQKLSTKKTVALYCRSGRRSKTAASILAPMGYQVVELSSGYAGWTAAGKKVTKQQHL